MSLLTIAFFAYLTFHHSLNPYSNAFSTTSPWKGNLKCREVPSFFRDQAVGIVFSTTKLSSNADYSDIELLLRKAKELRAQAEAEENQLHSSLIDKQSSQDLETDALIDKIFPLESTTAAIVAQCIERKRLSKDMLIRVVERLHNREVAAKGLDHVEPSVHHSHVKFERVALHNQTELDRVKGLIDQLIDAATILDERFFSNEAGEKVVMHNVDHTHWSTGELSKILKEKAKFLGREHDKQFKSRQEEYYEAARKKDKKRP